MSRPVDSDLRKARSLTKAGRLAEAENIYLQILQKFPKNKKALDRIKTLANRPLANTLVSGEPPNDQLQVLVKLYTQGQYQEALNKGSQLLEQFPNSINLYNIIGAASQGLGKLEEAIEATTKQYLSSLIMLRPITTWAMLSKSKAS